MIAVTFTLHSELADIVHPGVLWLDGATVVEREPRMDAPLAAAEAAVRDTGLIDTLVGLSKCPDYVVNRGHYFGADLPASDKEALIEVGYAGHALPAVNMVPVKMWEHAEE